MPAAAEGCDGKFYHSCMQGFQLPPSEQTALAVTHLVLEKLRMELAVAGCESGRLPSMPGRSPEDPVQDSRSYGCLSATVFRCLWHLVLCHPTETALIRAHQTRNSQRRVLGVWQGLHNILLPSPSKPRCMYTSRPFNNALLVGD